MTAFHAHDPVLFRQSFAGRMDPWRRGHVKQVWSAKQSAFGAAIDVEAEDERIVKVMTGLGDEIAHLKRTKKVA